MDETNCHDCTFATKINTDTYRCRRKRYDIVRKTCFVPRKEMMEKDREGEEAYNKLHEIADDERKENEKCSG